MQFHCNVRVFWILIYQYILRYIYQLKYFYISIYQYISTLILLKGSRWVREPCHSAVSQHGGLLPRETQPTSSTSRDKPMLFSLTYHGAHACIKINIKPPWKWKYLCCISRQKKKKENLGPIYINWMSSHDFGIIPNNTLIISDVFPVVLRALKLPGRC